MSRWSNRGLALLAFPALPLAFVALPLYVMWPHYFANRFGVSLGLIGGLLLLTRVMDAVLDPVLGHWIDTLLARSGMRLLRRSWLAALVLSLGFLLLFFPHWLLGTSVTLDLLMSLVLVALLASYVGYSFLSIALQTWGARLSGNAAERSRLVGWREGLGLCGVLLASLVPGIWGMEALVSGFVLLLGLAMWAWYVAPAPEASSEDSSHRPKLGEGMRQPWVNAGFRRLLLVFMLNGIASAIPATLMLFFVEDRLQLPPSLQSQFLGVYFLAAVLSLPVWLKGIERFGLRACWLASMALAVSAFIWTLGLSAGDEVAYTLVCLFCGLALGADLIAPAALLNGLLQATHHSNSHSGAYLGWWQVATKLNLALAAGISLPLLQWLGYTSGSRDAPALLALSWAYALLPCLLKMLAGWVLWQSRQLIQPME
jgi:Na+/melibiose symporter-like transporter